MAVDDDVARARDEWLAAEDEVHHLTDVAPFDTELFVELERQAYELRRRYYALLARRHGTRPPAGVL